MPFFPEDFRYIILLCKRDYYVKIILKLKLYNWIANLMYIVMCFDGKI